MTQHFDPLEAARELEAEGFEHRQALAIANMIRGRVLAPIASGRDEDADATVAAINETRAHLDKRIDDTRVYLDGRIDETRVHLEARIDRLDAKIDTVAKDIRHELVIASRDAAEKAADKVTGRLGLWLGMATAFLGLMIAASAVLPAVVALFK